MFKWIKSSSEMVFDGADMAALQALKLVVASSDNRVRYLIVVSVYIYGTLSEAMIISPIR